MTWDQWFMAGVSALLIMGVFFVVTNIWWVERKRRKDFHNFWGFWPDRKEGEEAKQLHVDFLAGRMEDESARLIELVVETAFIDTSIEEKKISAKSAEDYQEFCHKNWERQNKKVKRQEFLISHFGYKEEKDQPKKKEPENSTQPNHQVVPA